MTRFWPEGERVQVEVDGLHRPLCVTWRGARHPVERVCARWRVDEGWWNRHVWREYFKVATQTGLLVVVYRDFVTGDWFLQRLYD